jgi:hypothetical protein
MDQNQIIAPHLMTMRNAEKPFNEADKPTHTITSGGAHMHLVAAFMAKHFGGHETPGWPVDRRVPSPQGGSSRIGCSQSAAPVRHRRRIRSR